MLSFYKVTEQSGQSVLTIWKISTLFYSYNFLNDQTIAKCYANTQIWWDLNCWIAKIMILSFSAQLL